MPNETDQIDGGTIRFPGARLSVVKGVDKGKELNLRGRVVRVGTDPDCDLVLTDSSVSRQHFEIAAGPGGFRLRDLGSTNGVLIDSVRVVDAWLQDRVRLAVGRTELRFEPLKEQVEWPLSANVRFGEVIGPGAPMRRVFALLERAALSTAPILLEGESGTGKASLARAVHAAGGRSEGPFIDVPVVPGDAAAIERELFGASPAGPGDVSVGALAEAEGGTVYLSDVADLPAATQHRLLRLLDTGTLGGRRLDVRLIVSTERNLDAEQEAGAFRADLLLALSTVRVRVPSLRERIEDIPALTRHFTPGAQRATGSSEPATLSDRELTMLARYDWPGNVRELRSVVERLHALSGVPLEALLRSSTPIAERSNKDEVEALVQLPYHDAKERVLQQFEQTYFTAHMKKARGSVGRAAQRMGLPRQSLYRMLRRWGIDDSGE